MSDPQAALSRAQDVLQDALDEARAIVGNPSAGAKPLAVAEAVLEASPLVDEALDGWPETPDGIEGPGGGGGGADPDLRGMTAYQPEPGTAQELTAALDELARDPAGRYIRCKGSLALTGTYVIGQSGGPGAPLIITAPAATIGERDPGPKPSFKHIGITGSNVRLHGFAAELPPSDVAAAVVIADGADDVTVSRCWLDAPSGVEVHAAKRFAILANDFYGEVGEGGGDQVNVVVAKSGPLPEDGLIGRNFLAQLRDFKPAGICCYSSPGVSNPSGDKSKPYDRNLRSTVMCENYIRSVRKYLVYHKHAMRVVRNRVVSLARHGDATGTGDAYHVLASRGGNWLGGLWACNVCEAGDGAHCDVQGWDGVAERNDFGGVAVNVWCGMDQADGKALLGADGWSFVGNDGGKYQVGTTRNGAYWLAWPLEGVTWEGEVGASWRWEGAAPEGSAYDPAGGPEIPWGPDGTNGQQLTLREGGEAKVAVAAGALRRVAGARAGDPMPLARDLDETNTGLAYRG